MLGRVRAFAVDRGKPASVVHGEVLHGQSVDRDSASSWRRSGTVHPISRYLGRPYGGQSVPQSLRVLVVQG